MTHETETFAVGGAGVAWRETGGEIVILDLSGSVYFGLNGTGAQLWKRLLEGATRGDLLGVLARCADRSETQVQADLDGFLAGLDGYGLLHRSRPPASDAVNRTNH